MQNKITTAITIHFNISNSSKGDENRRGDGDHNIGLDTRTLRKDI